MENSGLWVPGPRLFLLLLLSPPLLSAGSFQHSVLNWRNFHHRLDLGWWRNIHHSLSPDWRSFHRSASQQRNKEDKLSDCDGDFDVYFVLDASESVSDSWKDICNLVEGMVKKYTNPRLRMSFITYSTQGNTIMKLTSNRNVIKNSLKRLRNIVPKGARNMQEGLKKANEQIYKVQSSNFGASSLIFTLTAGPLQPSAVQETKQEADKARRMKAKVYCIGMKDYKAYQLNKFIEAKTHFFNMEQIEDQKRLIASIVGNSCVELMAKDTYYVCVGNDYSLEFYTYGLEPEKIGEYSCRYKLDETEVFSKPPISVTEEVIICPGHIFDKDGQVVVVDYTLDQGETYNQDLFKVMGKDCLHVIQAP